MDDDEHDQGTVSWLTLRDEAVARLAAAGVERPGQEARWIVEEASGFEGPDHLLHLDDLATEKGVARLDAMVGRRVAGEPLQYVLGRWAFRRLDLAVDRRVLIPRPETEALVDHVLGELDRIGAPAPLVVDLGTGSGAIGLSVATERTGVAVWATDRSPDALAVARANLAGIGGFAAARVRLAEGDWFDALPAELRGTVTVVASNPPYVSPTDELPAAVRDWEPTDALIPGPTGLEAIEVILGAAPQWLVPAGAVVVEIGETQGEAVVAMARGAGFAEAELRPDLAGRDRTLVARLP